MFKTDDGIIMLSAVDSVQCYARDACVVTFCSGAIASIDIKYSNALILAVEAHHNDGSPVAVPDRDRLAFVAGKDLPPVREPGATDSAKRPDEPKPT